MTPAELTRTVLATVRRAVAAGELRVDTMPERIAVQRPPRPGCGDYATNVALQLAAAAGRSPHEVARVLAHRLAREPGISQVEVAGPGFLNITLDARAYADVVRQVRTQRAAYGHGDALAGQAVSMTAAPGAVRGAVVAETVDRLLRAAGAAPGAPEAVQVAEPEPMPGPQKHPQPAAPQPMLPTVAVPAVPVAPGAPAQPAALVAPAAPTPAPFGSTPLAVVEPGTPPGPGARPQPLAPLGALIPPGALAAPDTPVPLDDLGSDAARWALLRPPAEDVPRPTRELLRQHESNPLFRVRYAYARTRALLRNARDLGIDLETHEGADPGPAHPAETELLGLIADFPRVVESAARRRAPDRLARHLERLADAFARFHDECPVLPAGDEKPAAVHAARLRLTDAAGIVLAGGLDLLGITAPDRL